MGISTHILDTALGRPAAEVPLTISIEEAGGWTVLAEAATDVDGRCQHLLPTACDLRAGTYRIRFRTADYYAAQKLRGLYPLVDVTFVVTDPKQHYHIPLLLTANGYTTYRGS